MPRDGSGIYSRPAGIDAVTDTTIESAKYNLNVQDVEADLNLPRPIAAGGTGASNAHDAMVALSGELTHQVVTNYDTFPFVAGSFSSAPAATNGPVAGHAFAGICYVYDPDNVNLVLEARDLNDAFPSTGKLYIRRKHNAGWDSWVWDGQGYTDLDNMRVAKSGDTMTGDLRIAKDTPTLTLEKGTTVETACIVYGVKGGKTLWSLQPGDSSTMSGGNAGANFSLFRYDDAGTIIGPALQINRSDGHILCNGYTPSATNDLTSKAYVDGLVAPLNTAIAGLGTSKVAKAGDTMSGNLAVPTLVASGEVQAQGGVVRFNAAGTRSLEWDNGIGAFHLYGGDLWTNGFIGTLGGALYVRALAGAGNNATVNLQDEAGTPKVILSWNRAAGRAEINTGASNVFAMGTTGIINTANGMYGKAGSGAGAYDANAHNFYWTGSAAQVWIDATNVGTLTITCDYRIKKDIAPLASTWDAVKALKPISYTQAEFTPPANKLMYAKEAAALHKADPKVTVPVQPPTFVADDIPRWGFIAHELQATLLPSAASGTKDSPNEVQSPNVLAIVAALTRALQEAMARIEALEVSG